MAAKLTKKYFVGDALTNKWTSVYNYRPQTPEILENKGEIFAVTSLFSEVKDFNATTAGNLLVDCLHESYFESKKELVTEALASAIKEVQERLSELLAHEEEVAEKGVDFDITVVVVRESEIYFASLGSHKIYLLPFAEATELIDITTALRDPFGKGMVKIGSSYLQSDQRFLLASAALVEEVEKEELLLSLSTFNDLRLKNIEFAKPEEIAFFMLGLDVTVIPSATVNDEKTIQQLLAEEPEAMEPGADMLQLSEPDLEEYQEVETDTPEIMPQQTAQPPKTQPIDLVNKAKGFLINLPASGRSILDNYKKNKQIRDLQKQRSEASVRNYPSGEQFAAPVPEPVNGSTIQVLLAKLKARLFVFKDVVLYDYLQVNQSGRFPLSRGSNGFKVLVIAGVILAVIAIYGLISSRGAAQARENKIREANDQLTYIKTELNRVQASPVLNSRSFADITQRKELLSDLTDLDGRFSGDIELLPSDVVTTEKDRLASLRQSILRRKQPLTSLLTDVGNIFEGNVSDMVLAGENLYILDSAKGSIYRQPIQGGTPELLLDGLDNPTAIAADSNGDLIITDNNSTSRVALINPATKAVNRVAGVSATQLPAVSQLAVYPNNNSVYTISNDSPVVRVLKRSGKSYTLPSTRYSAQGDAFIKDIQILDGRIILLIPGQGFIRVDVPDSRLEAFDEVLETVKQSDYLAADEEYLYFADAETKKVYVFTKYREGSSISDFVAEYDLPELNTDIVEIVVSKDKNLVFVASQTRVYTFPRNS